MPTVFHFIRHGESQSNAGEKTLHPQTVALTAKGHAQAQEKAAGFTARPDCIITSPYLRTKQTAAPFLEKFGHPPQHEWDIHEFTFLCAEKYNGTTTFERVPFIEDYWRRADPFYKDDGTGESFAEFSQRCAQAIKAMQNAPTGIHLAFSHGYFMKGLLFHLDGGFHDMNAKTMESFRHYHATHKMDNCAELRFALNGNTLDVSGRPQSFVPETATLD